MDARAHCVVPTLISSRTFRMRFSECVMTKRLRDFSKCHENKSIIRSYYNAECCQHYRRQKTDTECARNKLGNIISIILKMIMHFSGVNQCGY